MAVMASALRLMKQAIQTARQTYPDYENVRAALDGWTRPLILRRPSSMRLLL